MNIYNAIMKAAETIEQNPDLYDFFQGTVVHDRSPGCALVWIGRHAGAAPGNSVQTVAQEVLNCTGEWCTNQEFMNRMNALSARTMRGGVWTQDAKKCATCLRLYAEKYHGHEKPQPVAPNWQAIAASPLIPEYVKSEELVS